MRPYPEYILSPARLLGEADRLLIGFYRRMARNARGLARLALALFPLICLLAGSCKTAGDSPAADLRALLLPRMERGYIQTARDFLAAAPQLAAALTSTDLEALYGVPDLRRKDGDVAVLQYKAGGCVVDFYLYGPGPVAHVDVRLDGGRQLGVTAHDQSRCLARLAHPGFIRFLS